MLSLTDLHNSKDPTSVHTAGKGPVISLLIPMRCLRADLFYSSLRAGQVQAWMQRGRHQGGQAFIYVCLSLAIDLVWIL